MNAHLMKVILHPVDFDATSPASPAAGRVSLVTTHRSTMKSALQFAWRSTRWMASFAIFSVSLTSAADPFLASHSQPRPIQTISAGNSGLTVTLVDGGPDARWRLKGELAWRTSGQTVANLLTGTHWLEFKPVTGRSVPAPGTTADVGAGSVTLLSANYTIITEPVGSGWVRVEDRIDGPAPEGNFWRIAGETSWRRRGAKSAALPCGVVTVEYRSFPGFVTPDVGLARILPDQGVLLEPTYLPEAAGSWSFAPVDPAALNSAPFRYVGMIHSSRGTFTGTAVGQYTVLTTLEAVYDPDTRSFVSGVTWSPVHHAGTRTPAPRKSAGFVLMADYRSDALLVESKGLVAIYFTKSAADGGWSGFHEEGNQASAWLNGERLARAIGYAGESGPAAGRGKLCQTGLVPLPVPSETGVVRTLSGFPDVPGLRGASLFTRRSDGRDYPAAVFLGGSPARFRVIDGDVATLIKTAEDSALLDNGGTFSLGEKIGVGSYGSGSVAKGRVRTYLEGVGNGQWTLANASYDSGARVEAEPGTLNVGFVAKDGFAAPASRGVNVVSNVTVELLARYSQTFAHWENSVFSLAERSGGSTGSLDDFDRDGVINLFEWVFDQDPKIGVTKVSNQKEPGMPLVEMMQSGSGLTVHYFRLKSAVEAGVSFDVQFSSDLSSSVWTSAISEDVEDFDSRWERVSVSDPAPPGSPRRFARVSVIEPSTP